MKKTLLALAAFVLTPAGFMAYKEQPLLVIQQVPLIKKAELPIHSPKWQAMLDEYEAFVKESMEATGVPGVAVAIVKDSSIIYLKGFGVRDVQTNDPVDLHTVFRLASVSKCFSSLLTATLLEDSLLSLNDPVIKYLPGFSLHNADQTEKLTVQHVLSHSTGLPYHAYTNLIEEGYGLREMLAQLKEVALISPSGAVYAYQNVAYSLIGEVIEAATGKTFEEQMRARVFYPLGMVDASLTYHDIEDNKNVAQPHLRRGRKWRRIPISDKYYNVAPAGGINASISDMAKWMQAMLGNRQAVVSDVALATLFEPRVRAGAKNRNFNQWSRIRKSYYGLGWRILHFQQDTLAYHGGYVNGYRSEVVIHPKERLAICILANGPTRFSDLAIPSFFKVYDKYRMASQPRKEPVIASAAGGL